MIEFSAADGLCTLRLNAPRLNTISLTLLEQLRAAIRRANADQGVRGIVLTGGSEHFSAGADVGLFQQVAGDEDAVRISRLFQEAFQEVEDSPKPVVAAVAGRVIGGALELVMACHFRVAAEGSTFQMPEVHLAINPGSGGTQRLPRLVGLPQAVRMLLTGQAISSTEARLLGLVDAVCPSELLVESARQLLATHPLPRKTSNRSEKVSDAAANQVVWNDAAKLLEKTRPELIAPACILAAVRAGIEESFEAGLLKEQEEFAKCMRSLAARNKIYLFFATRQAGKVEETRRGQETHAERGAPRAERGVADDERGEFGGVGRPAPSAVERPTPSANGVESPTPSAVGGGTEGNASPRPLRAGEGQGVRAVDAVAKAAVVGMGSMGTGIAQALLMAGLPVVVREENEAALARGTEKIRHSLEKRIGRGKLSAQQAADMLGLLSTTTEWEPMADAGLVIEAVFEDAAVKRAVLERLESVCPAETILATNTSTISLDLFTSHLRHPERLLGLHFFNPAHSMPLVEVIHTAQTAPWAIARALQLTKRLRKTAVLVKNREGFLVTRLLVPYCKEAYWLLAEGASAEAIDAAMVEFGFPMGPLTMIDMTGIDILAHADAVLGRAFPSHGGLPPVVERLIAQGRLGQKTGGGVYDYEPGSTTPRPSAATSAVLDAVRRESGLTPCRIGSREIVRRLVLRMVNEAFYVLEEGIAQRESDIDVALVLGLGFPDFRGGVLKYARDLGLGSVCDDLQKLATQFGERFSPCELLRNMKGAG